MNRTAKIPFPTQRVKEGYILIQGHGCEFGYLEKQMAPNVNYQAYNFVCYPLTATGNPGGKVTYNIGAHAVGPGWITGTIEECWDVAISKMESALKIVRNDLEEVNSFLSEYKKAQANNHGKLKWGQAYKWADDTICWEPHHRAGSGLYIPKKGAEVFKLVGRTWDETQVIDDGDSNISLYTVPSAQNDPQYGGKLALAGYKNTIRRALISAKRRLCLLVSALTMTCMKARQGRDEQRQGFWASWGKIEKACHAMMNEWHASLVSDTEVFTKYKEVMNQIKEGRNK